jgi:hypothetical protein
MAREPRTYRYEIILRKPSGEEVVLGKCAGWTERDRYLAVHKKADRVMARPIHGAPVHGLTHVMHDIGDNEGGLWGFVGLRSIMPHEMKANT